MASDSESQKIETNNATVHMNSRVYYVTIPMDTVRKLSIKRDDLVMIKIAHTSPPDGF